MNIIIVKRLSRFYLVFSGTAFDTKLRNSLIKGASLIIKSERTTITRPIFVYSLVAQTCGMRRRDGTNWRDTKPRLRCISKFRSLMNELTISLSLCMTKLNIPQKPLLNKSQLFVSCCKYWAGGIQDNILSIGTKYHFAYQGSFS